MRRNMMTAFIAGSMIVLVPSLAFAQEVTNDMDPASDVTRYLLDSGLLILGGLAGLVLIAGFALRDIGLSRTLNAPAVCLRTIGALALTVFAFWLSGYQLLFGVETNGVLGEFGVWSPRDEDPAALGYSSGAFWFFHMVLAAFGAMIVSSAVSERVRLWPFLFFAFIWSVLIYPIVASWAWGGGYFASEWSFHDIGGAGVIHVSAGAAALAAVMVVGPRNGRYAQGPGRPAVSTALPLSAFGVMLAIVGMMLVIAGLSGSFSSVEAAISLGKMLSNAMLAMAGGSLAAMVLTQTVYKRTGLVSAMTGAIAGIVSISAEPLGPALWQAAMIGAVGGVIITVTPPFFDRYRIDDAGLSIPTHLLCGFWGVLIAFWVNEDVWLIGQALGVVAIAAFSFSMSLLIWVAVKYTIGVRSAPLDEPSFSDPTNG